MRKLRDNFSRKEWKDCCTKLCEDCRIASAYIKKHGFDKARKKMKKDQKKVLS